MQRRDLLGMSVGAMLATKGLSAFAEEGAHRDRMPLHYFSRRPLMELVALSPGAKRLAAIASIDGNSTLLSRDLETGASRTILASDNLEFQLNWFRWVNEDRLLLSLRYPSRRFVPGSALPIETVERRLVAVNHDGSDLVQLISDRGSNARQIRWAVSQDRVVDWLPKDGRHVLLELPASENNHDTAIYKVDFYTASRREYAPARKDVRAWILDQQHRVRVGMSYDQEGRSAIQVCDPQGDNWRTIGEHQAFDEEQMVPLGFGLDPQLLYLRARHASMWAVFTLDLKSPDSRPQLKLAHPRFELTGALIHNGQGEAVGIAEASSEGSSQFYWDEDFKALQVEIDKALPGRFNTIVSSALHADVHVIEVEKRGQPAALYLLKMGERSSLSMIASSYPELVGKPLAQRRAMKLTARDGLSLHGYLTVPAGIDEPSKASLVVFPHGGPQSSDGPEFDSWAAFMADRGHLVLQLNFRGSTGYGQTHLKAGLRRWGLEMQDDLEDGVRHLVELGWVDPQRVAIVGASYGGYAALMGVVKTPRLYRGAFAFAPVTDLIAHTEEWGQFSMRETVRRQIGDPWDDRAQLAATSPVLQAGKVQVPVVLFHGTLDRQVDHRHSVRMAEALTAAGKEVQFVSLPHGDHQLSHQPFRDQLFGALERFLDKVLAA